MKNICFVCERDKQQHSCCCYFCAIVFLLLFFCSTHKTRLLAEDQRAEMKLKKTKQKNKQLIKNNQSHLSNEHIRKTIINNILC